MGRVQDAMKRATGAEGGDIDLPLRQDPAGGFQTEEGSADSPNVADASTDPPVIGEAPAGQALERDELDDPDAAEGRDQSVLLQRFSPRLQSKVVVDAGMVESSREQYRRLAASLHHAQEATGTKVVMIASAVAGEGKSLTAANLALTFSESYQRSVLLVDGDLRRPSLHTLFGIDATSGLSDALMAVEDPEMAIYQVSDRLAILPAGRPSSDPMAGLTSIRMRRLLEEARQSFEWVFIDTPPVGLLSDANLLAAMVDAALLVIRADRTPYYLVQRAADAIGRDRILGAVLNQASAPLHGYAYEYYQYYQAPRAEPARGA